MCSLNKLHTDVSCPKMHIFSNKWSVSGLSHTFPLLSINDSIFEPILVYVIFWFWLENLCKSGFLFSISSSSSRKKCFDFFCLLFSTSEQQHRSSAKPTKLDFARLRLLDEAKFNNNITDHTLANLVEKVDYFNNTVCKKMRPTRFLVLHPKCGKIRFYHI